MFLGHANELRFIPLDILGVQKLNFLYTHPFGPKVTPVDRTSLGQFTCAKISRNGCGVEKNTEKNFPKNAFSNELQFTPLTIFSHLKKCLPRRDP